jgi:hypothetical protein
LAGTWSGSRSREKRFKKLAQSIEALVEKDDKLIQQTREIEELRRLGALQLHAICAGFVAGVNRHLKNAALEFDPPEYSPEAFRGDGPNLFQINVRGRIVEVEFEASETLISTEDFRLPYILKGAVRGFNQQLLDREAIEEQLLFYTLEKKQNGWRYFDARTYRTGFFDGEYLLALMEQLV